MSLGKRPTLSPSSCRRQPPAQRLRHLDRGGKILGNGRVLARLVDHTKQTPGATSLVRSRPIEPAIDESRSVAYAANVCRRRRTTSRGSSPSSLLTLNSLRPTPWASYQCQCRTPRRPRRTLDACVKTKRPARTFSDTRPADSISPRCWNHHGARGGRNFSEKRLDLIARYRL